MMKKNKQKRLETLTNKELQTKVATKLDKCIYVDIDTLVEIY